MSEVSLETFVNVTADMNLWAGVSLVAVILILAFGLFRVVRRSKQIAPNWVVVDGSNVMYWKDNTPQIDTVRECCST